MGLQGVHLREFKEEELLLDEEETRRVLIFFFPDQEINIKSIAITIQLRSFAQGLMVEAIDASYAMGWVDLAKSLFHPRPSSKDIKKMVKKFLKEAARHWFKHLKGGNFMEAEIYETVRTVISNNFIMDLRQYFVSKGNMRSPLFAWVNYQKIA